MMKISIVAMAIAIVLPMMISAECQCLASGDPHYVMCDKNTKFDLQAEGLFTAFKSEDLEVQVYQKMAIGKPYAIVDYCSIKYVKDDCTFVMKSRSIDAPNDVVVNGQKMPVTNAANFLEKELDKSLGITMDKDHNAVFKTKDGIVQVACQPWEFLVRAPQTKKCDGLCGNCSGKPQTKPPKPLQYASKEVHQHSGSCKPKPPTPKPTTAAPTTMPTPRPTNATTAPTTMPTPAPVTNITNTTTPAPTTAATPAPTTPAPTTAGATPAPTTAAATPAPTTAAPTASATSAPSPAPTANATSAPTSAPVANATSAPTSAPVANATSAPTSAPVANVTSAPTPAPSVNATSDPTTAPMNTSLVPPPVKEVEKAKIVGHPVFESEEVMKKVVNACMCGQPKERMEHDKMFGGFVENCIYDKSLGPDDEGVAAANMETFLKALTPIPEVIVEGDNITVAPAPPAQPVTTVIGNITYSNANFDTSAIRQKHVTKSPMEIPPTDGVSYRLRYTVPDDDVALLPELMPRPVVFTGAGERSEPIIPTPAQQMVMAQIGMSSPVSPAAPAAGSPVSYLAPNNAAPMQPMPARPPMPMRSDGNRFPFSDRLQPNSNDDKLKVHFDLEAPIIVTAK